MWWLSGLSWTALFAILVSNFQTAASRNNLLSLRDNALQNIITYDNNSLLVHGERLFIFSGEFHPFRLPSPGLYLDVFQKIKAMGFNCVSFYLYWGLMEGQRGRVVTDGIWDPKPFLDAASEAGIYLLARPGPYINAETAVGGMPGWTTRLNCTLRSNCTEYTDAMELYLSTVGKIIADAQITNGGPVVLVQPENEYATWPNETFAEFPEAFNRAYMAKVEQSLRDAGIVVPFIVNDNEHMGYWAPDTGVGSAQLYGIDAYPMRYACNEPTVWPNTEFPRDWQILHLNTSPSTPFLIPEFQGGSGTGWGPNSVSQDSCNALVNEQSVRVLYKNNFSFGTKLLNIYMTFGGTNWGNLGYEGGDSSYDYGAAITESRGVWREKYSEEKLEAFFLKVSPAYLTAIPGAARNGTEVSTVDVTITPVVSINQPQTMFWVVRQADWTSGVTTTYTVTLPISSLGGRNVTIPQLGNAHLTLFGRDSKIHVTDYDLGGVNLVYGTADIATWQYSSTSGERVLVMYGGAGETHEFAFASTYGKPAQAVGTGVLVEEQDGLFVIQWFVSEQAQIVCLPSAKLTIYLLWRNDAYNLWVLELPSSSAIIGNYSSPSKESVVVKGGYLMRTTGIEGRELSITGDLNATTDFELLFEPSGQVDVLSFNSRDVPVSKPPTPGPILTTTLIFSPLSLSLPDFTTLEWRYIDSLPELSVSYDDSAWVECNHTSSTNDQLGLMTPTSLYASDYGFHAGSLLYRGHFIAKNDGERMDVALNISGGSAFGASVWLNGTFIGSWTGNVANSTASLTFNLPPSLTLIDGKNYVLTVLIDHMGQNEEAPGTDAVKFPYGILNFSLSGYEQSDLTWKLTGNLGGEDYRDLTRGPRNEGALYAERQGFHLPSPPSNGWEVRSPFEDAAISRPGVGFFTTSFELDIEEGYDVPLSFVFPAIPANETGSNYRVQLFVNGYQFGEYLHNLGPQNAYPVPEGILNHNGKNYIALSLWAQDPSGASLTAVELTPQMPVLTAYPRPAAAPQPAWTKRAGAY